MKDLFSRRLGGFVLIACFAAAVSASAQDYPNKPIHVVVPWTAGGVADTTARVVSDRLGQELGAAVVVDNKPGASGMIGSEFVAKASPDGYTLVLVTASTHAIGPHVFAKVPYNAIRDFTPIAMATTAPAILVVSPSLPVSNVAELVALAKSKPGKINYASFGNGSSAHLAAELFKQATGIDMVHVPYKGAAPALVDLMGGSVQVFFDSIPSSLPHVRSGKLKALAVTSPQRTAAAPDIPTVSETIPGFEVSVFQGFAGPAGMPLPIVTKLNGAINRVLQNEAVKKTLVDLGADPVATTPEDFAAYIRKENDKWAKIVAEANIPLFE